MWSFGKAENPFTAITPESTLAWSGSTWLGPIYGPNKTKLCTALWLSGRVFANGPENRGSFPGRVIPKTLKWYLIPPCLTLSIIRYLSRVKCSNPGKGVVSFPTPLCSSYWKGNLLTALDYGRQLYLHWTPCKQKTKLYLGYSELLVMHCNT